MFDVWSLIFPEDPRRGPGLVMADWLKKDVNEITHFTRICNKYFPLANRVLQFLMLYLFLKALLMRCLFPAIVIDKKPPKAKINKSSRKFVPWKYTADIARLYSCKVFLPWGVQKCDTGLKWVKKKDWTKPCP